MGIIVMKIFLFAVLVGCVTTAVGSFNTNVERFFSKVFHKIFN